MSEQMHTRRVHIGDPKFKWEDSALRDRIANVAHLAQSTGVNVAIILNRAELNTLKKSVGLGLEAEDPKHIFGCPLQVVDQ